MNQIKGYGSSISRSYYKNSRWEGATNRRQAIGGPSLVKDYIPGIQGIQLYSGFSHCGIAIRPTAMPAAIKPSRVKTIKTMSRRERRFSGRSDDTSRGS